MNNGGTYTVDTLPYTLNPPQRKALQCLLFVTYTPSKGFLYFVAVLQIKEEQEETDADYLSGMVYGSDI